MAGRCPTCGGKIVPQELSEEASQLERQIYELNGKIRKSALPPGPELDQILEQHKQLVQRYRAAGGHRL